MLFCLIYFINFVFSLIFNPVLLVFYEGTSLCRVSVSSVDLSSLGCSVRLSLYREVVLSYSNYQWAQKLLKIHVSFYYREATSNPHKVLLNISNKKTANKKTKKIKAMFFPLFSLHFSLSSLECLIRPPFSAPPWLMRQ